LFADATAGVPEPKTLGEIYAPFGRLIHCETVITVESALIQPPIVGLITENILHTGKLASDSRRHGGSQHGANRPAVRAHRQRQQLDVGLAGRQGIPAQILSKECRGGGCGCGQCPF
jgi:hypothetical protein